jgi:uncharacterized protein with HEPN domain
MQRDEEHLVDILEAARLAISYVQGRTDQVFLADVQCQDAVIRRLEVIVEACFGGNEIGDSRCSVG